jgi:TetR/AcrR family transcriptional regulator, transcriptional repressor for nem operon
VTTSADHPTRLALLDVGTQLGARSGLARLSINDVVQEANVAKGTFYVHFKDRTDYLVSLHRRFHDRLFATVVSATAGLQPGASRLQLSIAAYLDGCLTEPLTRAILFDAHYEPAIQAEVNRRNEFATQPICADLDAMGVPLLSETARLVIAMTVDIAIAEHEATGPLPLLRSALMELLKLRQGI